MDEQTFDCPVISQIKKSISVSGSEVISKEIVAIPPDREGSTVKRYQAEFLSPIPQQLTPPARSQIFPVFLKPGSATTILLLLQSVCGNSQSC